MKVHFKKYHGLGNDYLVIDPNIQEVNLTPMMSLFLKMASLLSELSLWKGKYRYV